MRGRALLRVLARDPLRYEVVRQAGSHRTLVSRAGYPTIVVAFHDAADIPPHRVRAVLVGQVGLSVAEAFALL